VVVVVVVVVVEGEGQVEASGAARLSLSHVQRSTGPTFLPPFSGALSLLLALLIPLLTRLTCYYSTSSREGNVSVRLLCHRSSCSAPCRGASTVCAPYRQGVPRAGATLFQGEPAAA
jgi:hypothetical protein